jgi:hypothetical protein
MDYINSNAKLKTVPDLNGGVNYYEEPHKIRDNQLSDVCNMEFEDGILRQRSGYEGLFSEEEHGEILAIKEFNNNYYCVTSDQFLSVDKESFQKTVLIDGMSNVKGGTFLVKNDILYYFSGKEIYKFNSYLSSFKTIKCPEITKTAMCEIEPGIYTDGSTVYNFNKPDISSYSISETFESDHICFYKNDLTIYTVEHPDYTEPNITLRTIKLKKEDEIYSVISQENISLKLSPFLDDGYWHNGGTKIRRVDAVKGYLLFLLDRAQEIYSNDHGSYSLRMTKYNFATGEFEYTAYNQIYDTYGDIVVTITEGKDIKIENYETGETKLISLKNDPTKIANCRLGYSSNTDLQKEVLPSFIVIAKDIFLLTALEEVEKINSNRYQLHFNTKLYKILDDRLYILDQLPRDQYLHPLKKIGSNYYEIPIDMPFAELLGIKQVKNKVTVYNFSKNNIAKGQAYIAPNDVIGGPYDFCISTGIYYKLSSSEFQPVKVEGYTPTVLNARYNGTLKAYEMINFEQYNMISNKINIKVIEAVEIESTTSSARTMIVPIRADMIHKSDDKADIITDHAGVITITDMKDGTTRLDKEGEAFVVGETITITLVDFETDNPVRNCHLAIPYGGSSYTEGSGTRLFAAGDPKNGNTYYYSDVNNFEYFPELNFDILDNSSAPITGFAKHYQDLIVFKSDSISKLSYQYEESKVVFPVVNVHDSIGCDMPGSIQMVNNDVVFGNALKGLHLLSIKELSEERNVFPISMNLNGKKGLGKYSVFEKQNARSFDFKNKYYLAVGDDIYIWNYELTPFQGYQENISWYVWRDIPVSSFCTAGDCLAFVPRGSFALYAFNGAKDDGGKAIRASFTTKAFDFGDANALKAVWQVWMNITSDRDFPLYFKSVNEKGECLGHIVSFHANRHFGNVMTRRMKHKRILYLGFHLENGEQGTAFDVSNIKIEYEIYKSRR